MFFQREAKRIINQNAKAEATAVSILDTSVKQNVDINFHRFRTEPVHVVVLNVLHCIPEVMESGMLEFFNSPHATEISTNLSTRFAPYSNTEWRPNHPHKATKDPNSLRRADHIYLELFYNLRSYWPVRSRGLSMTQNYEREYKEIAGKLDAMDAAYEAVANSHNFHKLLETILHMGNFMNGPNKQARGFRLSNLEYLSITKDDSSTMSLLHFIESTVRHGLNPEIAHFIEDMQPVIRLSDSSMEGPRQRCQEYFSLVGGVAESLSKGSLSDPKMIHPEDRCIEVISPAAAKAQKLSARLQKRLESVESRMKSSMTLYGEDYTDKEDVHTFFEKFSNFVMLYNQARDDNLRREEDKRVYEKRQQQYREREQKLKEQKEKAAEQGQTHADSILEKLKNPDSSRRRKQEPKPEPRIEPVHEPVDELGAKPKPASASTEQEETGSPFDDDTGANIGDQARRLLEEMNGV